MKYSLHTNGVIMNIENSFNQDGDHWSEQHEGSDDSNIDEKELVPLSHITVKLEDCEEETIPMLDISNSALAGSAHHTIPLYFPANNSYPTFSSPVRLTPRSTPRERRRNRLAITGESPNGRTDSSDSQIVDTHNQLSSVTKSSAYRCVRNVNNVAIEVSKEIIKSNTQVPSTEDSKDDEEQILELLRLIVRKCTNTETNKRPSADEVDTLLNSS